jgi:hypothetical protein
VDASAYIALADATVYWQYGSAQCLSGKDITGYDFLSISIEDFDEVEKLGQCFSSADPLEEIDIGDEITPMPAFVNKTISFEHKDAIIKLLKYYVNCFT